MLLNQRKCETPFSTNHAAITRIITLNSRGASIEIQESEFLLQFQSLFDRSEELGEEAKGDLSIIIMFSRRIRGGTRLGSPFFTLNLTVLPLECSIFSRLCLISKSRKQASMSFPILSSLEHHIEASTLSLPAKISG